MADDFDYGLHGLVNFEDKILILIIVCVKSFQVVWLSIIPMIHAIFTHIIHYSQFYLDARIWTKYTLLYILV